MTSAEIVRITALCTFLAGALVTLAALLAAVVYPPLWTLAVTTAAATPVAAVALAVRSAGDHASPAR